MIDIETSSIKPSEGEILEIGVLELNQERDGFFSAGRSMEKILHFDEVVTDPWILNTHKELLPKCKIAEFQSPVEIRAELLAFFRRCNGDKDVFLMGLNASAFDLPWLYNKNMLRPEDVHYRTFELSGAYGMAQTVLNYDRKTFFKEANASCEWITLPPGQAHSALYDCYSQLRTLNGAIKLLRVGAM